MALGFRQSEHSTESCVQLRGEHMQRIDVETNSINNTRKCVQDNMTCVGRFNIYVRDDCHAVVGACFVVARRT